MTHSHTHQHGHAHDAGDGNVASERLRLRTVGIDIGTTTSHLIFSELVLERQGIRLSSAYTVVERNVIHPSDVSLTPYASARRIDTDALAAFIARSYEAAGWTPQTVDTGAVITTGEAARKENAAAIVGLFSGQAGRFVCATAGHHLEALLAAHGSGAVARSRSDETPLVLNVDIGGGTTKLAVCRHGHVDETAAIDVGARLVSWNGDGTVRAVTSAGQRVAAAAGVRVSAGDRPDRDVLGTLAEKIAEIALRVPEGQPMGDDELWLTEPLHTRGPFPALVFSGGVGEYVNGNETREFGDLGKLVGAAIAKRLGGHEVLRAVESIRATCIGASQYTIQVSGDTLFLSDSAILPLRDLAAIAIRPAAASATDIARTVRAGIARLDREDGAFAIAVRWQHGPAYAALRELCTGIGDAVRDVLPADRPLVVVLDADVAGIVGQVLQDEVGVRSPIVCVDQIQLSDLDFIDIGELVPEKAVVPVVVKSLVFSAR
ncbi:MAG TPA: ethanolamine ammonia-lyase reactivating factor EutA [Candidatus Limnocylindria bacterium]|nr:ethanolamine ammonia-lyase reactivating factor EutA [Candidatus Limnocylindria bacterium]